MPEVSVIIPVYNSSRFINEALESVFTQTFKDYEIILVDDGSTDNTRQIIEKYSDKLIYFRQENGGPAKARNFGIKKSRGKFIAFLDADDIWLPLKLERQIDAFKKNPELGMVATDNSLFDEKGVYRKSVGKKDYLLKGDIVRNILIHSGVVTPTVMVRREVFDALGLFEEQLRIAEDDNMWIRISSHYDIDVIDEPLAKIRDHQFRTMRTSGNLAQYVEKNMQLLTSNYGDEVKRRVEPIIPRKLTEMYFNQGYSKLEKHEFKAARKYFITALGYDKWNWKCYFYILTSVIPVQIVNLLKFCKRRIFPAKYNQPRWTR
jgi:glycosyltransferase involved in cell wall biosynthesis